MQLSVLKGGDGGPPLRILRLEQAPRTGYFSERSCWLLVQVLRMRMQWFRKRQEKRACWTGLHQVVWLTGGRVSSIFSHSDSGVMCAGIKETLKKWNVREMKCKYGMEDGKERAGWSTGGGAGCPEWTTVPKDLVRLKALPLPYFCSLHPWSKMTTLKIQLVHDGASP